MKTYNIVDIKCMEIRMRGKKVRLYNFKNLVKREDARKIADRIERNKSVFIVNCWTNHNTFI